MIDWTAATVCSVLLILMIVLVSISNLHGRWKKGWLSELVETRLSEISRRRSQEEPEKPRIGRRRMIAERWLRVLENWDDFTTYLKTTFTKDLLHPTFPSILSFAILTTLIALFFIVPHPPPFTEVLHWHLRDWWEAFTSDLSAENERTERLITGAFTGLAVVVIALVIFVAKSIRDDKDSDRKRVLVSISFLWPLGLAATIIPFGFLWSASRGVTVVLEAIVAGMTIYSFARVIRAMFDPEVGASDRLVLLRGRVRGMIFESVRERIGNSLLIDQLGSGKRIDTLHYLISRVWIVDPQHYVFIDASKEGWISDIQLVELQRLGDRLDRHAREVLGFGLRESGPTVRAATTQIGTAGSPDPKLSLQKAYLLKRYREEIPPDSIFYGKNRAVFALPEAFAKSPEVLADIQATIPHIFRFTKDEPSAVAIRREMQGTKDQLAQAIRDHALGEIDELRQIYLQIAEEFLTLLVEHGGGYTAEQAKKERSNYFESWTEVRWLLDDLRELITIAVDVGNIDILGKVAFLPFAISMRAVQARDHFLFQQFYQFAVFLYVLAMEKEESSPIRIWMVEKSWRWPKEIADFYIAHELDARANSPSELEQMRGFALYSLRVLQDLMKLMMDKRDVSAFATVAREFRELYGRFLDTDNQPQIELLNFQIERAENDEQRALLRQRLERQQKCSDIAAALNLAINEIFLALGGRILAQRLEAPADERSDKIFASIVALLPNTLEGLAATFAAASDLYASDTWGWGQWDVIADGKAHFVDTYTKLNQIFALRALELLAALSPEQRSAVQLPPNPLLADMARENNQRGVISTLNAIEADPQRWQPVLSARAREVIGSLRQKLAAAFSADQENAAERTRDEPLDPAKVTEFRAEVVQSFGESGRLRNILAAKGALEIDLAKKPGAWVKTLGLNQIDDKNAFIAQEHTSYAGWGRAYGESLAHGEDEECFSIMLRRAKKREAIASSAVVATIGRLMDEAKLKDPIVLHTLQFDARYYEIERHQTFMPKYHSDLRSPWRDFNGFMGLLSVGSRQVPIFDAFVRNPHSQNMVLILDAQQYVRWRQFAPDNEAGEASYADGQLLIRVIDLNADEERRDEIISQGPLWLAQESDPAEYLRGRVLLIIREKFHVEVLDANQAVCVTVSELPV